MTILAKYEKQPGDTQDFDINFSDYLYALGDTGASVSVVADTGLTINSSTLLAGITTEKSTAPGTTVANGKVKVWTSGGTSLVNYKITATLTSTGGRIKQAEIIVKVKEY